MRKRRKPEEGSGKEAFRIVPLESKGVEVADILREYLPGYQKKHKISARQRQVLEAIKECRTPGMGYHLNECDECGYQEWMYNSCRDRHCPKCQWVDQQAWVEERMLELPRVPYHHVVSTIPGQLHDVMLLNKAVVYQLVFEAVAETIQTFGRDPKHLGAEVGIIAVLHTWGQMLNYHVHMHCLVTGGGLTKDGEWVEGKYSKKFLFPVRAMSQVFRGKFIAKLRKAYKEKKLKLEGKIAWMENPAKFEAYIGQLSRQIFRIRSKPATRKAENVIRYLGAYMKRGPISNGRIEGMEEGRVRFRYKDNRNGGVERICEMAAEEFIRRYVCHVLPKGFVRVRYYGIFAGPKRKENLELLRTLTGTIDDAEEETGEEEFCPLRCIKVNC